MSENARHSISVDHLKTGSISVQIRQAAPGDARAIALIWTEGIASAVPALTNDQGTLPEEHFRNALALQDGTFQLWVAELSGMGIVGWQSLMPCRNNPVLRTSMAESSTYVSANARGYQIGTKLLEHAINHAVHSPLRYLLAFVAAGNEPMLRVSQKLGFEIAMTMPGSPRLSASHPWHLLVYTVPAI